jgi:hypothetical protein
MTFFAPDWFSATFFRRSTSVCRLTHHVVSQQQFPQERRSIYVFLIFELTFNSSDLLNDPSRVYLRPFFTLVIGPHKLAFYSVLSLPREF